MDTTALSLLSTLERKAVERTINDIIEWIIPQGLDIQVTAQDDNEHPTRLGMYEAGSIYSKNIEIVISPKAIHDYIETYTTDWEIDDDLQKAHWEIHDNIQKEYAAFQAAVTVYHELGHALVEQIIDWMENIPEFDEIIGEDSIERYDAVLEDSLPEEKLVEDFAWNSIQGKEHVLKVCFLELSEKLSKL